MFKSNYRKIVSILLIAIFAMSLFLSDGITSVYADELKPLYRIGGKDRYETSYRVAKEYVKARGEGQLDNIIIASGENYADALSGSYLSKVAEAPILLVNKNNIFLVAEWVGELLKPKGRVYILGGTKAIPKFMEQELGSIGYSRIKRLKGKDALGTNLAVLKEGDRLASLKEDGKPDNTVVVCSGNGYADALSAGATGHPIMLVRKKLTADQKTYLRQRKTAQYYVIGGIAAVPESVENWCKSRRETTRIKGKNRYETSVNLAKKLFKKNPQAVVASGNSFPDGLSGCSLAQLKECPILLAGTNDVATSYNYEKTINLQSATIMGGKKVISNEWVCVPGYGLKNGWNKVGVNYVYVNADGKIETKKINDGKKAFTPSVGGIVKYLEKDGLIWPVVGPITSYVGRRSGLPAWASTNHGGIDVGVYYNTPIKAAQAGKVVYPTGWWGGYGYAVVIQHEDGSLAIYGHCNSILVNRGQKVKQGQVVAKSGSTGNSTGPHLHFEVRVNGVPIDPLDYLPFNKYWTGGSRKND